VTSTYSARVGAGDGEGEGLGAGGAGAPRMRSSAQSMADMRASLVGIRSYYQG
jgi:hypothetical protein